MSVKAKKSYKKGGKFPDLTGDGKVTQADILKGRGIKDKKRRKGSKVVAAGADKADVRAERKMKKNLAKAVKKYKKQ